MSFFLLNINFSSIPTVVLERNNSEKETVSIESRRSLVLLLGFFFFLSLFYFIFFLQNCRSEAMGTSGINNRARFKFVEDGKRNKKKEKEKEKEKKS